MEQKFYVLADVAIRRLLPNHLTEKLTGLHKEMPNIYPSSYYESLLTEMSQKRYTKKTFQLSSPSKQDVVKALENEADYVIGKTGEGIEDKKTKFVADRIDKVYKDKIEQWKKLKDFFEEMETYRESKQNDIYREEFIQERNQLEKMISGDETYVNSKIVELFNSMKLPYDIICEVHYDKKNHCSTIGVELPNDFGIPLQKHVQMVRLGSTLKDKLQREITQETTDCTLSLAYYLAGQLFDISVNIDSVYALLWNPGRQYGVLWANFDRDKFSALERSRILPSMDIYNWPHVMDEKMVRGAIRLDPIFHQTFLSRIKEQTDFLGTHTNFVKETILSQRQTKCILSIEDALLIRDNIIDNTEISEAIELAYSEGKPSVVMDLKYEKLLKEIKES